MARYHPPKSISVPFKTMVLRADPDFERTRTRDVEYEFSNGRSFSANPNRRGAFNTSLFTPLDLGSQLLAYWDAEYSATLFTDPDTGRVRRWEDVLTGMAFTQDTVECKPIYSATSFNGYPGVTFDGEDDFMRMDFQPFGDESKQYDIWVALENVATGGLGIAMLIGSVSNNRRSIGITNGNRGIIATGDPNTNVTGSSVDAGPGRHAITGKYRTSSAFLEVDGEPDGSATGLSPNVVTDYCLLGSSNNAFFLSGRIAAVVVTKPLTVDEALVMTDYMLTRKR